MPQDFGSAGAGVSRRALGLKTAGAHSTKSLKISGCKRRCFKDLRVCAPAAPVLTHFLQKQIMAYWILPKNERWGIFQYITLPQRSFFGRIQDNKFFLRFSDLQVVLVSSISNFFGNKISPPNKWMWNKNAYLQLFGFNMLGIL